MDKLFYPESVVIVGLSSNPRGISRVVLENLLRWGFGGKIFGVNPHSHDGYVKGIKVYNALTELPEVPDLAVCLIPARLIPDQVEQCGKLGIQRMAIPTGGFAEFNEDGRRLTDLMVENAQRYGVRIVGPNGLTVANSRNGLCLPFLPFCKPREGNISIISQSGGVSAIMLGLLMGEHMGLAKYVSIGNKVDLDEIDFLRYFGADGDTQIIWLYLESIDRGRELIEAAKRIDKPIILYKANTTSAGKKAALSHTAALSNDENVIDAAMEEAGIIRIHNFRDFASMTKAFQLPPMRGNRIMVMSPAGGFAVLTADLCEQAGFDFAHPGDAFYDALKQYVTAGVINLSNPLDMGDLYDTAAITRVFFSVMHNENVDGAVYVSEWPSWAEGDDVFTTMFRTDFSKEIRGAIVSSRKPFGICLFGAPGTVAEIKGNVQFPIFDSPEEMIRCLAAQRDFCLRLKREPVSEKRPDIIDVAAAKEWLHEHGGIIGGESLELLRLYGITVVETLTARDEGEAIEMARKLTYPVVMKVDSPDALHKTEAQGVVLNITNDEEMKTAFAKIEKGLRAFKADAVFKGVRLQPMAGDGYDMFIGGKHDDSFGPVVLFGLGGIYVEIFKDVDLALCPSCREVIEAKVKRLTTYALLTGARGKQGGEITSYIDSVLRVSYLMADFADIRELDINPIRILADGSGMVALDARMKIGP